LPAPAATAAVAAPPVQAPQRKRPSPLLLIVAAVVLLAGGVGGTWFYMSKHRAAAAGEDEPVAHAPEVRHAPTYLPLESMVVNLADAGGERFAQIGVTLDIENEKTAEQIKTFMPAIRSSVLMLVSQRTSEELLKRDGKEKLAADIVAEVSQALGYETDEPQPKAKKAAKAESGDAEEPAPRRKKKRSAPSPVNGVLFSSFIVQ